MQNGQNRLWLVDADTARRKATAKALAAQGYRVEPVADSAALASRAGADDVALVYAATADGAAAVPRASSTQAPLPSIVVLPAKTPAASVEAWLAAGADDVLVEPVPAALLQRRVAAALAPARLNAQLVEVTVRNRTMEKMVDDFMLSILPLGVALSAERDFDRLGERIVLEAKSICNADGGTLYLRTNDNRLSFAILHTTSLDFAMGGTTGREIPFPPLRLYNDAGEPNFRNVATHVAIDGQSINIPDVYEAKDFDFSGTRAFDQNTGYRTISNLTVPLKNHEDEVIGVLQLLNAQDRETGKVVPFSPYLQQVTESLASQAAVALNNQLLLQRQRQLLKIERDMEIARTIQAGFLPDKLLQPEGWEFAARFHPARQVSGDFYDVFPLPGDHVGFVIADVCDKGVGAALFMALFRSLIRAFSEQSPTHMLTILAGGLRSMGKGSVNQKLANLVTSVNALNTIVLTNNYIAHNHEAANMFATMFFGVLEPATGLLNYVNCGHNPPALFNPDGLKARLTLTGPAVGMMPDMGFDIQEMYMEPGDLLMTFTDGVPESRAKSGEFFTEKRLLAMIERASMPADDLLQKIDDSVRAHIGSADQFDDITMLAVRRKPA